MVLLRDFHRQLGGAPAPASTRTKKISWGWGCCVTSIDSWTVHLRLHARVQ